MRRTITAFFYILLMLFIVFLVIIFVIGFTLAAPTSVQVISNSTETGPTLPASNFSAEGGTITTLIFNATMISEAWKGYVGNITGTVSLRDSDDYVLYNWQLASITGEIFASRSSTIIWANINCSNASMLAAEDVALSIPVSNIDSINKTFAAFAHKSFYVGNRLITNSTCPAIATHVNNTAQALSESSSFQEVVLDDGASLVFSTLLEQNVAGFDVQPYDFQLIVPDNYTSDVTTPYYFWAELS